MKGIRLYSVEKNTSFRRSFPVFSRKKHLAQKETSCIQPKKAPHSDVMFLYSAEKTPQSEGIRLIQLEKILRSKGVYLYSAKGTHKILNKTKKGMLFIESEMLVEAIQWQRCRVRRP